MGPLDPVAPPTGTPAWYVREAPLAGNRWQMRCVIDSAQADGSILDDPVDTEGMYVHWRCGLDPSGRAWIYPTAMDLASVPSLWFVEVRERSSATSAVNLVAFATSDFPAGTVISNERFFSLPMSSDQQVGAVRWWIDDGVIDQVFVAPAWRRRGLGSLILFCADSYHQFNGWPGVIHSDGRRTAMGDALVGAMQFPARIAALMERMAPMDPASEEANAD